MIRARELINALDEADILAGVLDQGARVYVLSGSEKRLISNVLVERERGESIILLEVEEG